MANFGANYFIHPANLKIRDSSFDLNEESEGFKTVQNVLGSLAKKVKSPCLLTGINWALKYSVTRKTRSDWGRVTQIGQMHQAEIERFSCQKRSNVSNWAWGAIVFFSCSRSGPVFVLRIMNYMNYFYLLAFWASLWVRLLTWSFADLASS